MTPEVLLHGLENTPKQLGFDGELMASSLSPLNIIDLMYRGAYFTRSMVQFGSDPLDDELYSIFETFPPDPQKKLHPVSRWLELTYGFATTGGTSTHLAVNHP